eukprot:Skav234464  [mRNA]  locus=scaffold1647:213707:218263:+ [translate_table: standard]
MASVDVDVDDLELILEDAEAQQILADEAFARSLLQEEMQNSPVEVDSDSPVRKRKREPSCFAQMLDLDNLQMVPFLNPVPLILEFEPEVHGYDSKRARGIRSSLPGVDDPHSFLQVDLHGFSAFPHVEGSALSWKGSMHRSHLFPCTAKLLASLRRGLDDLDTVCATWSEEPLSEAGKKEVEEMPQSCNALLQAFVIFCVWFGNLNRRELVLCNGVMFVLFEVGSVLERRRAEMELGHDAVGIQAALAKRKQVRASRIAQLKAVGGLGTCGCCFDDELSSSRPEVTSTVLRCLDTSGCDGHFLDSSLEKAAGAAPQPRWRPSRRPGQALPAKDYAAWIAAHHPGLPVAEWL